MPQRTLTSFWVLRKGNWPLRRPVFIWPPLPNQRSIHGIQISDGGSITIDSSGPDKIFDTDDDITSALIRELEQELPRK